MPGGRGLRASDPARTPSGGLRLNTAYAFDKLAVARARARAKRIYTRGARARSAGDAPGPLPFPSSGFLTRSVSYAALRTCACTSARGDSRKRTREARGGGGEKLDAGVSQTLNRRVAADRRGFLFARHRVINARQIYKFSRRMEIIGTSILHRRASSSDSSQFHEFFSYEHTHRGVTPGRSRYSRARARG